MPANSSQNGLVSKHRDRAYRAGTSPQLDEGEEPDTSCHDRVMDAFRFWGDRVLTSHPCAGLFRPTHGWPR